MHGDSIPNTNTDYLSTCSDANASDPNPSEICKIESTPSLVLVSDDNSNTLNHSDNQKHEFRNNIIPLDVCCEDQVVENVEVTRVQNHTLSTNSINDINPHHHRYSQSDKSSSEESHLSHQLSPKTLSLLKSSITNGLRHRVVSHRGGSNSHSTQTNSLPSSPIRKKISMSFTLPDFSPTSSSLSPSQTSSYTKKSRRLLFHQQQQQGQGLPQLPLLIQRKSSQARAVLRNSNQRIQKGIHHLASKRRQRLEMKQKKRILLQQQKQQQQKKKSRIIVIPANHPIKVLWDICTIFITFLNAYATHTNIRDRKYEITLFVIFTEIWFVIDVLLNFITDYRSYDDNNKEIIHNSSSAVWGRYLTTWFAVDTLSLIPWEHLFVKPIIDIQNKRNIFVKWFFRSKAVVKVSRILRGRHFRLFGKVADNTKRIGIGGTRLLQLIIKYIPKYVVFYRNMKGVLVLKTLRQIHFMRKIIRAIWWKRYSGNNSEEEGEEEEVENDDQYDECNDSVDLSCDHDNTDSQDLTYTMWLIQQQPSRSQSLMQYLDSSYSSPQRKRPLHSRSDPNTYPKKSRPGPQDGFSYPITNPEKGQQGRLFYPTINPQEAIDRSQTTIQFSNHTGPLSQEQPGINTNDAIEYLTQDDKKRVLKNALEEKENMQPPSPQVDKIATPGRSSPLVAESSPHEEFTTWVEVPNLSESISLLSAEEVATGLVAQSRNTVESNKSRLLLAIPEDKEWLSDLDCFIRQNLEVFCATQHDIDLAEADRKYPVSLGQVGIRCLHCSLCKNGDGARGTSVAFPYAISGIYESVREFQRIHLEQCRNQPPDQQSKLESLRGSTSLRSVLRTYYVMAAKAIGLRDSTDGIQAGAIPEPIVREPKEYSVNRGANFILANTIRMTEVENEAYMSSSSFALKRDYSL